ncbi:MAG: ABC transporter ATP-binding protein, partial [Anaerolineae bacterium]|nr:ABC transporter ATP-binding protein [Anaerolineae bacterium]
MKEGEIVQRDTPRQLYNHPNDVFGGWFLGNPGMNFIEYEVESGAGGDQLCGPLFPSPVLVSGLNGHRKISIGIRPEHVRVGIAAAPAAVRGSVLRKSIVVGGQYLLAIRVGDKVLKAKAAPELGKQLQTDVWVECPLDRIILFGPEGHRLNAVLSVAESA